MTHEEMIAQWKKDPAFLKECEKVKPEFDAFARALSDDKISKKTQADGTAHSQSLK